MDGQDDLMTLAPAALEQHRKHAYLCTCTHDPSAGAA